MKLKVLSALLLGVFLIANSCNRSENTKSIDRSPVLAEVNGSPITANQFKEKLKEIERHLRINSDVYQQREDLLKSMISSELIYQNAIKENMQKDPQFKEYLVTYYLKRKIPQANVTDKEVKAYFDGKKPYIERVRVSHILIKADFKDPKSIKDAKEKASELLTRLRNGADFKTLAKKYSQDKGSAAKGGDVGWFPKRGKMVDEFSDVAFSLEKIGDLSKIVRTKYGFHIIKLTGSKRGLDFFKDSIKEKLALDKNRAKYKEFIKGMEKKADIKIFNEELKNIKIMKQPALTD